LPEITQTQQPGGVPAGLIALSAVALAVLAVSGWLGGQLAALGAGS
jgi:hypothetical protein